MGQPPRSEQDARLRQAFMAGKAATVRAGLALSNWKDPGPEALYPANTLRRLEMAARVHFGAGCSLLFEDWLSYGADNHLRSLIETFAHVAWILGRGMPPPPMDARARALCYELAMVNALLNEMDVADELARSLQTENPPESPRRDIERAQAELLQVHPADSCSCGGKGHGFWTVKKVLKQMADAPKGIRLEAAVVMYSLWKYTSRIDHHAGFERMLRFDGERRYIGPAEPWQRVQTFLSLLQVYGCIVGWVAEQYDRHIALELVREIGALSSHEALVEVAQARPELFTFRDQPETSG